MGWNVRRWLLLGYSNIYKAGTVQFSKALILSTIDAEFIGLVKMSNFTFDKLTVT